MESISRVYAVEGRDPVDELKQSVKNQILEAVRARRHGLRLTPEEERLIHEHLELVPVEHTEVEVLVDQCLELIPVIDGTPTLPEGTSID